MADILDLRNSANQAITFSVTRNAAFDNTVDFYQVNADGSVIEPNSGATIAPSEAGYAEAAIANRLGLDLRADNGSTTEFSAQLDGDALYAPVIAANGDFSAFNDGDSSNDPKVYFTYEAANVDGFDHVVSFEANQFGFEDLLNGGDRDFNDIIVVFESLNDSDNSGSSVDSDDSSSSDGMIKGENLVVNNTGIIATVDLETGELTEIFETDIRWTDIDIAPDNSVFGIDGSQLYSIDIEAQSVTPIGSHGVRSLNALEVGEDGTLYAASVLSPEIYTLNPANGTATEIGTIPFDAVSAGDLQFIDGTLYLADPQDLIALNVENGTFDGASSIGSFSLTGGSIRGITVDEDGDPIGFTENGDILTFDLATGATTSIGTVENNTEIDGSAAVPEGFSDESTPDNSQISGLKFNDLDGNGNIFSDLDSDNNGGEDNSRSNLEPTLTGVTIYLDTDNNGILDEGEPSQETDSNDRYLFEGLQAGTYTVREIVPDGFTQTAPTDGAYTVTLNDDEAIADLDFGNVSEMIAETETTEI